MKATTGKVHIGTSAEQGAQRGDIAASRSFVEVPPWWRGLGGGRVVSEGHGRAWRVEIWREHTGWHRSGDLGGGGAIEGGACRAWGEGVATRRRPADRGTTQTATWSTRERMLALGRADSTWPHAC